jgi:hypothetical protein
VIETHEYTGDFKERFTSTPSINTVGNATRICHAVFLTDLVTTLRRYTDVISFKGFTPHIALYAGCSSLKEKPLRQTNSRQARFSASSCRSAVSFSSASCDEALCSDDAVIGLYNAAGNVIET